MSRSSLVLLAIAFSVPSVGFAAGKKTYTLRYKFKPGDVIRYEVDHRADIQSTMEKTTQRAQTRSQSLKAWKVIDVLASGEMEMQNVVERVRMTNRLPDRAEQVFDSTKDETPPPGFADAAKAVGVPLSQFRIQPWGEVTDRTIKHHQPAADPHAPITVVLPQKPVAVGGSWDDEQEIKVQTEDGGTKEIQTRRHFTLKSVKSGVAVIEAKQQVLSTTTPSIDAQLAQRMLKGEIRFDVDRGRIMSQDLSVDRRIIGFAGPASRMHYQMRMQERLIEKTAFQERSVLVKKRKR